MKNSVKDISVQELIRVNLQFPKLSHSEVLKILELSLAEIKNFKNCICLPIVIIFMDYEEHLLRYIFTKYQYCTLSVVKVMALRSFKDSQL